MSSQSPERTVPPRRWTAVEANRRLADLNELLPRLRGWVVRLAEVHSEQKRLADFWGADVDAEDHVDHELKSRLTPNGATSPAGSRRQWTVSARRGSK